MNLANDTIHVALGTNFGESSVEVTIDYISELKYHQTWILKELS